MKIKKPLVSVLMTIYNHEKYLNNSIKSVLNQSYKKWELVAIDNGSTDNTPKIAKTTQENTLPTHLHLTKPPKVAETP